jgi:hypothetical protein
MMMMMTMTMIVMTIVISFITSLPNCYSHPSSSHPATHPPSMDAGRVRAAVAHEPAQGLLGRGRAAGRDDRRRAHGPAPGGERAE